MNINNIRVDECSGFFDTDESVYYPSLEDLILNGVFNFCGCGCPNKVFDQIYTGLVSIEKESPLEVDDLLLYVFDRDGLTEHGSSVCGSWLSPYGKAVLSFIKENLK